MRSDFAPSILLIPLFGLLVGAATTTSVSATVTLLAPNADLDLDNDASPADLRGVLSGSVTAIRHLNGSRRFSTSDDNWNTIDVCDVEGAPSTNDFIPEGDGKEILIVETGTDRFYKLRRPVGGANSPAGIQIEHVFLSATPCVPPVASFTWSAHDLIADFSNTSTGSPFAFSWNFGDGGMSALENPRHVYGSSNSWNVCLTATGTGGTSAPACQVISVAQVPSVLVPPNGTIDLDADGEVDLRAVASAACLPFSNLLRPLNGSEHSALSQAYDLVDLADAAPAIYAPGDFCHDAQEFHDTLLVRTGVGSVVKAWLPQNNAAGVRMQFELLELGIFSDGFESGSTGQWSAVQGLVWVAGTKLALVSGSRFRVVGLDEASIIEVRSARDLESATVSIGRGAGRFRFEFPLSSPAEMREPNFALLLSPLSSGDAEEARLAVSFVVGGEILLDLTSVHGLELRVPGEGLRLAGDRLEARALEPGGGGEPDEAARTPAAGNN